MHRKENKGAFRPREAGTSLAASGAHRGCSPARVPQQLSPPVTDGASRGVTVQNKAAPADQGVPSLGLWCLKRVNHTAGEQQTKNPHHTNNQHRTSFYRALAPPGSPVLSRVRHLNPADSTGSYRTGWGALRTRFKPLEHSGFPTIPPPQAPQHSSQPGRPVRAQTATIPSKPDPSPAAPWTATCAHTSLSRPLLELVLKHTKLPTRFH